MVAQSSEEASLMLSGMVTELAVAVAMVAESPPPQAARPTTAPARTALESAPRNIFLRIANSLCSHVPTRASADIANEPEFG